MTTRGAAWGAYKGIADALRRRIDGGEFAPGTVFPSEAALMTEYGVSRNTMRRALADLEKGGLVEPHPGLGRYVRGSVAGGESGSGGEAGAAVGAGGASSVPPHQYRRVAAELRAKIESGELQPGELIPSEAALQAQYAISRSTARQALMELQGAGLVEPVQGKGRFVREQPRRDD